MKINIDLSMTELTTTLDSFKSETQRAAQLSVENTELRNKSFQLTDKVRSLEYELSRTKGSLEYTKKDMEYFRTESTRWQEKFSALENELKKLRPNKDREALEKHDRYNEVLAFTAQGQKIQAIKLTRELLRIGLKEAKDLVESLPEAAIHNAPVPNTNFGCNKYDNDY